MSTMQESTLTIHMRRLIERIDVASPGELKETRAILRGIANDPATIISKAAIAKQLAALLARIMISLT